MVDHMNWSETVLCFWNCPYLALNFFFLFYVIDISLHHKKARDQYQMNTNAYNL